MPLVPQMKHFEQHLARTQNEWKWRDSKSARSRTLGREMSQIDPIVTPDYFFEERGMKHFNGGNWEPTLILGHMNQRNMGNYIMEARPVHSLAPIMEEQTL